MNRSEKRLYIRNIHRNKGLKKKHTKGAFGENPSYLKVVNLLEKPAINKPQPIENKGVTS